MTLAIVASLGCVDADFRIEGSQFPAGTEDHAMFDAGLVGVWRSAADDDAPEELLIRSSDGRTYEVSLREEGDDSPLELSGYVVDLVGLRVLNARGAQRQAAVVEGYLLFRYELQAPDGLEIWPFESSVWVDRGLGSADELFQYLQAHAGDETLYGEPTLYRRVSLWGAHAAIHDCGGTADHSTHVTILPAGARLGDRPGDVFISDIDHNHPRLLGWPACHAALAGAATVGGELSSIGQGFPSGEVAFRNR